MELTIIQDLANKIRAKKDFTHNFEDYGRYVASEEQLLRATSYKDFEGLHEILEYAFERKNERGYSSIGGWYDKKTGVYHLDLNYHWHDKKTAMDAAKYNRHKAIYDLREKKTILI